MDTAFFTDVIVFLPDKSDSSGSEVDRGNTASSFRSRAAILLEKNFQSTKASVTKETLISKGTELRVSVRTDALEAFRERMWELGFSVNGEARKSGIEGLGKGVSGITSFGREVRGGNC